MYSNQASQTDGTLNVRAMHGDLRLKKIQFYSKFYSGMTVQYVNKSECFVSMCKLQKSV